MPFDIGKQTIGVVIRDGQGKIRKEIEEALDNGQPLFMKTVPECHRPKGENPDAPISGCSSAKQSARFGSVRPQVRFLSP